MLSGATLERRQISGIRNLVAFAVEGLQPEAVIIVGPSGLQIGSGAATGSQASAEEQIGSAHEMASLIESRLRHLLEDTLPVQESRCFGGCTHELRPRSPHQRAFARPARHRAGAHSQAKQQRSPLRGGRFALHDAERAGRV